MKNVLLMAMLAVTSWCGAQSFEGGVFFGGSVYSGDLSPKVIPRYFNFMNPVGTVSLRMENGGVVGARANFSYTKLEGDDARSAHPSRKLAFNTRLIEASVLAEWFLVRDNFLGDRQPVTPYLYGGISVFHFSPETTMDGELIDLHALGSEGQGLEGFEDPYSKTQIAIPLGLGFRFQISRRSNLNVQIGTRKLFTDYLDDVSGEVLDFYRIVEEKGPEAARVSRPDVDVESGNFSRFFRRGGERYDGFIMMQVGFMTKLGY